MLKERTPATHAHQRTGFRWITLAAANTPGYSYKMAKVWRWQAALVGGLALWSSAMVNMSAADVSSSTSLVETRTALQIGHRRKLESKVFKEEREYWVWLPPSYTNTTYAPRRYPVLYVIDGASNFHWISGILQWMQTVSMQVPEMILIGICEVDYLRDLTPTRTTKDREGKEAEWLSKANTGGGPTFQIFLREELIVEVDKRYRTMPYRALVGWSLAGLGTLDALLQSPPAFKGFIAIDPTLYWDEETLLRRGNAVLAKENGVSGAVYLSSAGKPIRDDIKRFASLLKSAESERLRSKWEDFPNEDHGSLVITSFYNALLFLFDGYNVRQNTDVIENPASVKEHFANYSRKMGVQFLPSEEFVDSAAEELLSFFMDMEKAVYLLKLNVENYPQSAHAHERLADVYVRKGVTPLAIEHYRRSIALNPDSGRVRKRLIEIEIEKGPGTFNPSTPLTECQK
jgi:uncharacterized protein